MFLLVEMITLELDIGNSQFKGFSRPILDYRPFMRMVLFDIKIGKEYNSCVSGDDASYLTPIDPRCLSEIGI